MDELTAKTNKWNWCLLVALTMAILSLIPQINLWFIRGSDWNGAYVSPQGDEMLYSAYVNALLDGRTRKNDPFGGLDDSASMGLPESTFSIQFIPSYTITFFAHVFRLSASSAFICLLAVSAFFAAMSVFWLLDSLTADHRLAAVGTLFVLCLGWVAGRYGVFNTFFDIGIPALHFLRRYQPSAAFPLFFTFQILVWRALHATKRRWRLYSCLAGLTFVLLIFSYLYLWTAAAAWFVSIAILWLLLRPLDRSTILRVLSTIGVIAVLALVPYFYLVSRRPLTLDEQQTILSTHQPDLLRLHEFLGAVILLLLLVGIRRGRIKHIQSQVLFAASLAFLPFIVFNQQVVTGKAIQPFHFEIFAVNYSTLAALIVAIALLRKSLSRRLLVLTAVLSLAAGFIAVVVPSRLVFVPAAVANDRRIPVLLRLKELSIEDQTLSSLQKRGATSTLVFSPDFLLSRLLPTWTSQGTLLDLGGVDFGSITREESREFFYMHLYYSKVEPEILKKALMNQENNSSMDSSAASIVFGHERVTRALNLQYRPIEPNEIASEVQKYESYVNAFSQEQARKRPIAYAVIPGKSSFDYSNLDRWYERDSGERVGDYLLYRLKLRR